MSLEAHHRFILDTMQRNQDIARNIINELEAENARLKAEVERLTKAATEVDATWSVYENGLIETPEWVKRSQVRDAVSRLWLAAKEGKPHA